MDHAFSTPTNEIDFERFCCDFLKRHWPGSSPERWGRRGQKQHGVDIVDMNAIEPLRAGQCKFKKPGQLLSSDELRAEIEEAKAFNLDGLTIGHYTILTTSENDTDVQAAVITINRTHRKSGLFRVELLTWGRIEEILREHPELWDYVMGRSLKSLVAPLENQITETNRGISLVLERVETIGSDGHDARLDNARSQIDAYEYQNASLLLHAIKSNHWHDLKDGQRFLTVTYLAKIASAEGRFDDAGRLFIEAERYAPNEERARVNAIVGTELLGDTADAYRRARDLLGDFPQSSRLWAVICRAAPKCESAASLASQLPQSARIDDEVVTALSMRAAQANDFDGSARFAAEIVREGLKWAAPWLLLAQAKLSIASNSAYKPASGPATFDTSVSREAIISLFDTAIQLAKASRSDFLVVPALLSRGKLLDMMGEHSRAQSDFENAYLLAPSDPAVALSFGQYYLANGNPDAAFPLFQKALSLNNSPDARFFSALCIVSRSKQSDSSEWLQLAIEAAGSEQCAHRVTALDLAIGELLAQKRFIESEALIQQAEKTGINAIVAKAARYWIGCEKDPGELDIGARFEATDCAQASEELNVEELTFVATALLRKSDAEKALPLWEKIVATTKRAPDLWRLLQTARAIKRFDVILSVAREWRSAGVRDEALIQHELSVLEGLLPQQAVQLIESELARSPDDRSLILRRSLLGIRLNKVDLICADVARLPSADTTGVVEGAMSVRVLKNSGNAGDAIEYAYRLLRHNPKDHRAQIVFATEMLLYDRPDRCASLPLKVAAGVAVEYKEQGDEETKYFVIEEDQEAPGFDDELTSSHRMAIEALGKAVGDEFLVTGDSVDGIRGTIVALASKYVFRAHDILSKWHLRFPTIPAFQAFRVANKGAENANEFPDLLPIIRRTHARKRNIESIIAVYRDNPCPVHVLASAAGVHDIEAVGYLALTDGLFLQCCQDTPGEFERACKRASEASAYVLEISAIATMLLVGTVERLNEIPGKLIVSSKTFEELIKFAEGQGSKSGGFIAPSDTDFGVRFIPSSEEDRRTRLQQVDRLINTIQEYSEIVDCDELASMDPSERDQLMDAFGQHGAECVLLATREGSVLWADDFAIGAIAESQYAVKRVWTQAVLQSAVTRDCLTEAECSLASAKLMAYDYQSTTFGPLTLYSACEAASWEASNWPLKQILRAFGNEHNIRGKLIVLALFCRKTLTEAIVHPRQNEVLMAILDQLADGAAGADGVRGFVALARQVFGMNVIALERLIAIVKHWTRIRGSDE